MLLTYLFIAIAATAGGEALAPVLKLADGSDFPALGIGTWLGSRKKLDLSKLKGDEIQLAVEAAIDAGYRHIDTAAIYNTEEQVGRAISKKIADGVVKREELFVTTKLWNADHASEAVVPALRTSLQKLNLTYVDLYLIHWPVPLYANESLGDIDYLETWQGMQAARAAGLTRGIGVSNFNQEQLARLVASGVKPAVLQIEVNLNLQQSALRAYCRREDIAVTGYTPFGSLFPSKAAEGAPPPRVDAPELLAIAHKYNKTVPQITLRYLVELGVVPIPKSLSRARIKQNLEIFDFSLSAEERALLAGYDRGYRTNPGRQWLQSPYYPFEK